MRNINEKAVLRIKQLISFLLIAVGIVSLYMIHSFWIIVAVLFPIVATILNVEYRKKSAISFSLFSIGLMLSAAMAAMVFVSI